jgi:hypothetical protein
VPHPLTLRGSYAPSVDTGEDTNAANVHSHTAIRIVKVSMTKLGVKDVLSNSERSKEGEGEWKEGVLGGGEEGRK